VERRIARSTRIEEAIERVLLDGINSPDQLSQLGRLGAQLILQHAVEDQMAAFVGCARYERTPDATGSRNGHRPRWVQTAKGETTIAPQVRDTLSRGVCLGQYERPRTGST
jgi:transposase-like protein